MSEKEIYKEIVEREKWCRLCGGTYSLHIHHIIYRSQGGLTKKENIIRLCERCHRLVHSNKTYWQPRLIDMQHKLFGDFNVEDLKRCNKWMKKKNT